MYKIVEDKLAMMAAQKCGSRTVIAYAVLLRDPSAIDKNPNGFSSRGIYEYTIEFGKNITIKKEDAIKLNYPIISAIVRDPIDRFISSYANRMSFYKGNEPHSVQEFMDIYDSIPSKNIPHYSLDLFDKMHMYTNVKFHIFPLHKRYGSNAKFFTHIFNIKQMKEVKSLIEDLSKKKLPDLKLNESLPNEKPVLTESQKQWILDTFKKDIDIYGKWM